MNPRHMVLGLAAMSFVAAASADDSLDADLRGRVEMSGISEIGELVTIDVAGSATHPASGRVKIDMQAGQVRRIETYTEWSGPGETRVKARQRIWASGDEFVGWLESSIESAGGSSFSRTEIEGEFEQEIRQNGAGFIEWTTVGADNEIVEASQEADEDDEEDDTSSDSTDSEVDLTLPTVSIEETGEFDGVFDQRIEVHSNGDVEFTVDGFERVMVTSDLGITTETIINQELDLEGEGDGDLSYDDDEGEPDPTPTPSPSPLPTATPRTGETVTFDTESDDFFNF